MSLASIWGSGVVAFARWGTPCMIGWMQSTTNPMPSFAAPALKPAWLQASFICMHGAFPCASAGPALMKPAPAHDTAIAHAISPPRLVMDENHLSVCLL
jgi:hypothetical protein